MYTKDTLLDLAIQNQSILDEMRQQPGTTCDISADARRVRDKALVAALWMEQNNIEEIAHVGDFSSFELKKGQQVRLRRGAIIYSTSPSVGRGGKVNTLNRKIKVDYVNSGYIDIYSLYGFSDDSEKSVRNGQVNWAGAGGYWFWTDINNVEFI